MGLSLEDVERVFREHGHLAYAGEPVTQLEHALQCAALAEASGATEALVTATFLHDLGHMLNPLGDTPTARGVDDQHQYYAIPFLRPLFPPAVIEPIRLHVEAKRALCALEPEYLDRLTEDSVRSLGLQGGVHTSGEAKAFLAKPFAEDAMRLRRWDDDGKVAGLATPPLERYLGIAARCASA